MYIRTSHLPVDRFSPVIIPLRSSSIYLCAHPLTFLSSHSLFLAYPAMLSSKRITERKLDGTELCLKPWGHFTIRGFPELIRHLATDLVSNIEDTT